MSSTTILYQNGKLRLEMDVEGEMAVIRPVGMIDEDVNFSVVIQIVQELGNALKKIRFDAGHISGMNSCGVREWLLFMERLLPMAPACEFVNANELFVEQANMIGSMFGKKGTPVLSFQAPYHCPKCDTDVAVLLEPKQVTFSGEEAVAPAFKCKSCGEKLVFDSFEEEYFSFIKRL